MVKVFVIRKLAPFESGKKSLTRRPTGGGSHGLRRSARTPTRGRKRARKRCRHEIRHCFVFDILVVYMGRMLWAARVALPTGSRSPNRSQAAVDSSADGETAMARLDGTVSITDLPPHRGVHLSVCFFRVPSVDAPPLYDGDPPAEACTDCVDICSEEHLDRDRLDPAREWRFFADRAPGCYYVQLRAILYRSQNGRMFAQVEQFFFRRRPLQIPAEDQGSVTFPVAWPTERLEELHLYGKVSPQKSHPWWRFWSRV
jgi:hypothetical protein